MQGGYNFALIGVGYIAPRHLKAIKDVGGNLLCALDKHDSVGILDSFFPECHFFTDFELFDDFLSNAKIDYLVICSPNYLHAPQIRYGLKKGLKVICEKPLVINPKDLDIEGEVYTILQLRYHPSLLTFNAKGNHCVILEYCTPRGHWYHQSWKGNKNKSGGLLMNIGVHLFDMLLWKFGNVKRAWINNRTNKAVSGVLSLDKAKVYWSLSVEGERKRMMTVDGDIVDFNDGFTELHTTCYKDILAGNGYSIKDVKNTIKLISQLNESGSCNGIA